MQSENSEHVNFSATNFTWFSTAAANGAYPQSSAGISISSVLLAAAATRPPLPVAVTPRANFPYAANRHIFPWNYVRLPTVPAPKLPALVKYRMPTPKRTVPGTPPPKLYRQPAISGALTAPSDLATAVPLYESPPSAEEKISPEESEQIDDDDVEIIHEDFGGHNYSKPPQNFECPTCPNVYADRPSLVAHCLRHLSYSHSKERKISQTGETSDDSKISVRSHPYSQARKKPKGTEFQCHLCNKVCWSATTLNNHTVRAHTTADALHRCTVCDRTFTVAYHFDQHLAYHMGETFCSECGKAFKTPAGLALHKRWKLLKKLALQATINGIS